MGFHNRTTEVARHKWRDILPALGVPSFHLKNKHGPCPICAGKDRFRFDDKDGRGTFICNQCGAGDGMDLAIKFTGRGFAEVAAEIDAFVGNLEPEAPKPKMTHESQRELLHKTFKKTQPINQNDLAHRYFESRGIEELIYPKALRFAPQLNDGENNTRPALVAVVSGPNGKPATLHRTFLKSDGSGKADMISPRKLMPGEIPAGACVQLSEYFGTGALGIAEGIETALAASALYDIPVWAALNAGLLAKWTPPAGCSEVAIFGDNDVSYTGQAVAYTLARKLKAKRIEATVHIPDAIGEDWNDIYLRRQGQ